MFYSPMEEIENQAIVLRSEIKNEKFSEHTPMRSLCSRRVREE